MKSLWSNQPTERAIEPAENTTFTTGQIALGVDLFPFGIVSQNHSHSHLPKVQTVLFLYPSCMDHTGTCILTVDRNGDG